MENVLATTTAAPLDRSKPLVKEYFDRNAEIVNYLKVRLAHVPHAKAKINKLSVSKDGQTHKYRVNWYGEVATDLMTMQKIVFSQYVEVITSKDGKVIDFSVR